MEAWSLIQWPAMVATVGAAWLAGSERALRRKIGFWLFMLGNVLWIAWGWHDQAWALIVLQIALIGMNMRGARKNARQEEEE